MRLIIEKCWGKIFLELKGEAYVQILILDENGIEVSFIGSTPFLSLDGYYIANED